MPNEIVLHEHNTTGTCWLAAIASIPWSIFSLLLIVGGLNSSEPTLSFWGWVLLLLFFLAMTMVAAASVYAIPRSKFKVIWIEGDRTIKKTGRDVYQEIYSKSSPIKLRLRLIYTGKAYVEVLEAIGDNGEITIASSGYIGTLDKLIGKILEITNGSCIREEGSGNWGQTTGELGTDHEIARYQGLIRRK